jgi:hypothetical protein
MKFHRTFNKDWAIMFNPNDSSVEYLWVLAENFR